MTFRELVASVLGFCLLVVLACCAQTAESTSQHEATTSTTAELAVVLSSLSSITTSGVYQPVAAASSSSASSSSSSSIHSSSHAASSTRLTANNFEPTLPHKRLWPDWSRMDVTMFVAAAITLFIAAGGGIGGGAVFVPLFIFVGGFTAAQAVALSNITILGGAVANFLANSTKHHPFRPGPLIDYNLMLIMEPTTMLGALLGSYANKLFPSWFTSCLMAGLLVFLTYKLLLRGVATFMRESRSIALQRRQQQQRLAAGSNGSSLFEPLLSPYRDVPASPTGVGCGCDVHNGSKDSGAWNSEYAAGVTAALATAAATAAAATASHPTGHPAAWLGLQSTAGVNDQHQHPHQYQQQACIDGVVEEGACQVSHQRCSGGGNALDVAPVPAGLKPLVVPQTLLVRQASSNAMHTGAQHQAEQQQQQSMEGDTAATEAHAEAAGLVQQRQQQQHQQQQWQLPKQQWRQQSVEGPSSANAFSVESTPRRVHSSGSHDDTVGGGGGAAAAVSSPLRWSHDPVVRSTSPATAAAAAADDDDVAFSTNNFATQLQLMPAHQQQLRQWLLFSRRAVPAMSNSNNGSSSYLLDGCGAANVVCVSSHDAAAAAKGRGLGCCTPALLCCCSCFDPSRLQLATIHAYQDRQLPWQPLVMLFLLSCWVVASDTGKATLPCGSVPYWAVVLSVVPPAFLVTLLVRQWLLAKTAVEARAAAAAAAAASTPDALAAAAAAAAAGMTVAEHQQQQQQGVIHWMPRNSILYPLWCSVAGIFAGLFGVGGGIVKGPLMLELGVLPEVAAATSATMIMFTAGSAAVVYLNFGGVVMDYAQALLLLGFVVTLAGQLVATHLVRVLKRRSIIIFAMGTLMLLASLAAVYQMGVSTLAAIHHPPMWHWGSICQHR